MRVAASSPVTGPARPLRVRRGNRETKALLVLLLAALVCMLFPSGRTEASPGATITVNSTADTNARDGALTLREAMLLATGGLAVGDLDGEDGGECAQVSNSTYGPPCTTTDTIGTAAADAIIFDGTIFPLGAPAKITLASSLPALSTGADTVDGSGAGVIIEGVGVDFDCFQIHGSDANSIRGLQIGRCQAGVQIAWGAHNNTVGGTMASQRNVIYSSVHGVHIIGTDVSGNIVIGNYIGVDATGSAAAFNWRGVSIGWATNNTVGGRTDGERNIISGNNTGVILEDSASGNVVEGNYIGTNASGTAAIGNSCGVFMYPVFNNTIGGSAAGEGNVISGNGVGIRIYEGSDNILQGNFIGTNAAGIAPLGNGTNGVTISGSPGNAIGGTQSGAANRIAFNGGRGVEIDGAAGNSIRRNSIHSNGSVGIENFSGGNTELAPPIIDSVGGSVSGHSNPKCYPCTVEVFSDSEDEGGIYLDTTTTNDDATGTWTHSGWLVGPNITATITDAAGNTSEFSAPVAYSPPPVGGIAEPPEAAVSGAGSHGTSLPVLALATVAGLLALASAAAGWYVPRRTRNGRQV